LTSTKLKNHHHSLIPWFDRYGINDESEPDDDGQDEGAILDKFLSGLVATDDKTERELLCEKQIEEVESTLENLNQNDLTTATRWLKSKH
jgi:hypothetical protein